MGGLTSQRMLAGIAALAVALFAIYYFSQSASVPDGGGKSANVSAGSQALLAPGPLPEISEGRSDAKVTIVEYASMSCPHCAQFHNTVYPKIKEKYIDTGKVRFIFREFPLNNIALAGSMLARCVPAERTKDLIAELFKRQGEWLVDGKADDNLFEVVKQAGFTRVSFKKCLDDKALYEKLVAVRERGDKQFGVRSTPTFFINGKKHAGPGSLASLEQDIEPLLK